MTSHSRALAWAIWGFAAIFYAYQYVLRVLPSVMIDDILLRFDINMYEFGQFSGVYYIGYAAMHLPIGILLDRFGPKKVLPICVLLSVCSILPIIFASEWIYPVLGRLLLGVGSSAAILGAFKIIRLAFHEKHFTRMLSLCVTVGLIGAIYGGGPVSYMATKFGYQQVIGMLSIFGILLAAITYLTVPNIEPVHTKSVTKEVKQLFTNSKVMLICVFAGMLVGPLEGFADVWGPAFLKKVYNLDNVLAAGMSSIIYVGMCFGAPLLSLIAEKTQNYMGTIIASGVTMAVIFVALLTGKVSLDIMSIMFAIVGVCSAYQIIAIYQASTYVAENMVGITTALANMIIMIFGYGFHSIIGAVMEHMGGPNTEEAFLYAIAVIPVALITGTLGLILVALQGKYKRALKAV